MKIKRYIPAPVLQKYAEIELDESKHYYQLAEQMYDELADYLKDLQGWVPIGATSQALTSVDQLDDSPRARTGLVKRSRLLSRREPLSKQAIRLYSTYCGLLKVEIKTANRRAEVVWDDNFWKLRANKKVLSALYLKKLSNRLLTDGELFFVLFPTAAGEVMVRTIDPLQIPIGNILTHPEDSATVLFYKRELPTKPNSVTGATSTDVRYYMDRDLTQDDLSSAIEAGFEMPPENQIARSSDGTLARVFYVPFDPHGLRGNGLLFAAASYAENYRSFLQDRATIVRGLSTYIRTITTKSGSKALSDIASDLRSSRASGSYLESNPPHAPGSTWLQNQQLEKTETPPITHAGDAMSDARILRQPIASAVGITEANLTGDPAIGNLASQTQMEGPQLVNFEDYQQLWEETITELWLFVMEVNNIPVKESDVKVKLPPILKEPLNDIMAALDTGLNRRLIPYEEAVRTFLFALGSEDIEDHIRDLQTERESQPQTPPRSEEEDGPIPVEELSKCPFCGKGEKSIQSEHGLNYCTACGMTFHPTYYTEALEVYETLTEGRHYGQDSGNGKST